MSPRSVRSLRVTLACASVLLGVGISATRVAGQDTGQGQTGGPPTHAALPPSVLVVGVRPAQPSELHQYSFVESCNAAFERTLKMVSAQRTRDTTRHDTPIAPEAIAVGRQCLSRFPVADLPPTALPSTLRLAVAVNDDAMARAIVVRQLALVPAEDVLARAVVLDSAVQTLVYNSWDEVSGQTQHITAAHLQLARTYVPPLDALGEAALLQRIDVREALLGPAAEANDVRAQLALRRELQQILQPIAPNMTTDLGIKSIQNKHAISLLTYIQTLTHEDLAQYVAEVVAIAEEALHMKPQVTLGTSLPTVSCNYSFGTPTGGAAAAAAPGQLSVLLFVSQGELPWADDAKELRRMQKALPDVALTIITQTAGTFGNEVLIEHPEQEAQRIYHNFADSLQVPGRVCVLKADLQTLPNGHMIALPVQILKTFGGLVVVDPTGSVMYTRDLQHADVGPYGFDLLDFVRRLRAKFPSGSSPTPHS